MNKQAVIVSVIIFVLIVIGMFAYTYIKKQELSVTNNQEQVVDEDQVTEVDYGVDSIDAKKYFIDGTHTLVGEILMPTPCDLVDVSAMVAESYPEQVTLDFSVINTADSCIQQVTSQRFMVEVSASEEATFSARFLGESVRLNIVPAAPGETPDDFELYIKG